MNVYLDNLASTPIDPRVVAFMAPLLSGPPGNPHAAIHSFGAAARDVVENARSRVAAACGSRPSHVFFCPSATAANNLAVIGGAEARAGKGRHVLVSAIEHASVLEPAFELGRRGFAVEVVPVTGGGIIDPDAIRARLRPDTVLVSIMAVNNEVGTVQPIGAIRAVMRDHKAMLHCDASQAPGKIAMEVLSAADAITLSSHKVHGPKGAATLVFRPGREPRVRPVLFGGGQESGLWPGTVNVQAVAGFGVAMDIAAAELHADLARIHGLSERLMAGISRSFEGSVRNGAAGSVVPHCLSITLARARGETVFSALASAGIAVAFGSACSSPEPRGGRGVGGNSPSHVLTAMGLTAEQARRTLRFGPGRFTTNEEIDHVIEVLDKVGRSRPNRRVEAGGFERISERAGRDTEPPSGVGSTER